MVEDTASANMVAQLLQTRLVMLFRVSAAPGYCWSSAYCELSLNCAVFGFTIRFQ